jgi:hypothetical protein
LRRLDLRRRTLEEVFVDITSRDADPAAVERPAVPESQAADRPAAAPEDTGADV